MDYHPQYEQVCKMHCINIVLVVRLVGLDGGRYPQMMSQLLALHTTTPTR